VDDACRVGIGEGIRKLYREIDGAPGIERPAGDGGGQASARDELEHEEQLPVVFLDPVQRRDVRMGQCRSSACLSQNTIAPIGIGREAWRQHLDRDGPAEPGIARTVDLAQAAGADSIEDVVVPEGVKH
jgi:hypothetical protein